MPDAAAPSLRARAWPDRDGWMADGTTPVPLAPHCRFAGSKCRRAVQLVQVHSMMAGVVWPGGGQFKNVEQGAGNYRQLSGSVGADRIPIGRWAADTSPVLAYHACPGALSAPELPRGTGALSVVLCLPGVRHISLSGSELPISLYR
jgi:hypothetical protein